MDTTDSLPTEGVPQVEQLRRVGRGDEGQGDVSKRKKEKKKKNLSPAAIDDQCNVETLPPSLSLPDLSSGFFFFPPSRLYHLVLTCHSAHKGKCMGKENARTVFLYIAALLVTPRIKCVYVCPVRTRSVIPGETFCAARFLAGAGGGTCRWAPRILVTGHADVDASHLVSYLSLMLYHPTGRDTFGGLSASAGFASHVVLL